MCRAFDKLQDTPVGGMIGQYLSPCRPFVLLDIGLFIWADLNGELGISCECEWANIRLGINTAVLAVGCVFFVPFALKYERRVIYLASVIVSLATAIWQAKMMTTADLIGPNLIPGLSGVTVERRFDWYIKSFVRNVFAIIIATTLTPWVNVVGLADVAIMSTVFAFALALLSISIMIYGKRRRIWTAELLHIMAAKQYVSRRD